MTLDIVHSISLIKFSDEVEFACLFVAVVGGIWMYMDAADRFGTTWAVSIVALHLAATLVLIIPVLAILYVLYWLYDFYLQHKRIDTDLDAKFGFHPDTRDPAGDARAVGMPSVFGGKGIAGKVRLEGRDEHLDRLIADGNYPEALEYTEDMIRTAKGFNDSAGLALYRTYLQLLQREAK